MKMLLKYGLLLGLLVIYVGIVNELYDVDTVSYTIGVMGLFLVLLVDKLFDIINIEITYRKLTTKK